MKDKLFVLETSDERFVCLEQVGNKELDAFSLENYYNADKFDNEVEADTFVELINTGKTDNPSIRADWKIFIDKSLLPVKKRIIYTELVDEDGK